ncbi:hypothetical protein D3C78_1859330 [compost metagenome]
MPGNILESHFVGVEILFPADQHIHPFTRQGGEVRIDDLRTVSGIGQRGFGNEFRKIIGL